MPNQYADLPPFCEVRNWIVFAPGYWRKSLYSPADCQRVPVNFRELASVLPPVVKLGHDGNQQLKKRLQQSLGFLSLGDVSNVTADRSGQIALTITRIPTVVGGEINAGRIRSGSVELIPYLDRPDRPTERVQGPILTGISLLGEEHPAVKGLPPPRAVFADGRPVPPAHDPSPWLEAMAEVARMTAGFSDEYRQQTFSFGGVDYPLVAICFSEMSPMLTREKLEAIGGLTPEQIDAILAAESGAAPADAPGGDAPMPPPPPGGAPGGDAPMPPVGGMGADMGGAPASAGMPGPVATPLPDKKDMSQDDQTMFSDMQKRLMALEAKQSDAAKKDNEACMSAYAERVDRVLTDNVKRIPPKLRADYRAEGMRSLTTKCFGAVVNNQDAAFAKWKAVIEAMPESDKFAAEVDDSKPGKKGRTLTPGQQRIVNSERMKISAPQLRDKLISAGNGSAN